MKTKTEKVKNLNPAPYNPRKITDEKLEILGQSMKEFGDLSGIVVNIRTGNIIGGHQRVKHLDPDWTIHKQDHRDSLGTKALGHIETPFGRWTYREVDWPEVKEMAANVAANKHGGEFDQKTLKEVLSSIADGGLDMSLTGFDADELALIFRRSGLTDEDEIPDVPETPQTKAGDLYRFGNHRLLCGDSTNPENVERLMNGKRARICFTSPPYWLGFEYEQEENLKEILSHMDRAARIMADVVKSKIIINTGNIAPITKVKKITGKKQVALLIDWWQEALNRYGFLLRHIRIWAKAGGMKACAKNDSVDMHWEYIGTFTEEKGNAGFLANFYKEDVDFEGQNKLGELGKGWATSGIWTDIKGAARTNGHMAAFPVILPWRHLLMYTKKGDLVYEPYAGSGSTLIACEETGRTCYMMELNPAYCDVIVKRWEDFTGKRAERVSQ